MTKRTILPRWQDLNIRPLLPRVNTLPNCAVLRQVLVERQARAVRRQRTDAEKAAAETRSERLAAGATQREHLCCVARAGVHVNLFSAVLVITVCLGWQVASRASLGP